MPNHTLEIDKHARVASDVALDQPRTPADLAFGAEAGDIARHRGDLGRQPDWWRCYRLGPVSGRYEGAMTAPNAGSYALDLRVDIDPRQVNSPILDRVSGDVYQVFRFSWGGRTYSWRVFRYSWIIDDPEIEWSRCAVEITGTMRRFNGAHATTNVTIDIPWGTFRAAGPAEVAFTAASGTSRYNCTRRSDAFRDVTLEVDIARSVNGGPMLPSYDTHAHNNRPGSLQQRTLTVEEAYEEAGINLTIRAGHSEINDSAAQFTSWSVGELHDAMETHFSQIGGSWPKWELWGLLAGRYDNAGVGGIMFDAASVYGGSGEPPERQGFAVFRNHSWFNNLPNGAPSSQVEAAALRKFLYTWVHEAGHAFNFLHSWNKGRPNALSWMNYDWRYDNLNGANSFWQNFEMGFDTEELMHIRHGDRTSVIMGGDPWASGGHMEEAPDEIGMVEGDAPLELKLRSKGYFEHMEQVCIEARLRNLLPDLPVEIDARLDPSFGTIALQIMKPNGQLVEYEPVFCQLGDPAVQTLQGDAASYGADRFSQEICIDFGKTGHYFAEPGSYRVRALYQGLGNMLITSNVVTIRVGAPASRDEERLAQDYYAYPAGLALCLGGSRSPYLDRGMTVLQDVAERYKDSAVGARIMTTLAAGLARPFFHTPADGKMREVGKADPDRALALSSQALKVIKDDAAMNLGYHSLVRWRAELLAGRKQTPEAKKEVATLRKDLDKRGVRKAVIDDIATFEKSL